MDLELSKVFLFSLLFGGAKMKYMERPRTACKSFVGLADIPCSQGIHEFGTSQNINKGTMKTPTRYRWKSPKNMGLEDAVFFQGSMIFSSVFFQVS